MSGKTLNIAFQLLFAAMLQDKLHVFVARFTVALKGLYHEDTAV